MSDPTRESSTDRDITAVRRASAADPEPDQDPGRGPDDTAVRPAVPGDGLVTGEPAAEAHPVAVRLAGFFVGMVYVLVLPALWFVLSDPDLPADLRSVDLVYFVLAALVPMVLAIVPRTRRFGRYMLLGAVLSGFVVVGVAAVVVTVLILTGT